MPEQLTTEEVSEEPSRVPVVIKMADVALEEPARSQDGEGYPPIRLSAATSASSEKLLESFAELGVGFKIIKIEDGGEFSEAIILDKKETPAEYTVRIYRGVNNLDASIFEQVPYAMRAENEAGKPIILESVRQEVAALAERPTYAALLAYVDKVRPQLSQEEVRRLDEDVAIIEDGILQGYSTRQELVFGQIKHSGGRCDSGITPYISASYNPYEAAGYGAKGLVVLDIPLSRIEDFNPRSKEVNIKGVLDNKYITAVLPRKHRVSTTRDELSAQIARALQVVDELVPVSTSLGSSWGLHAERENKFTKDAELDKEQWKVDVELVRQKRAGKLVELFPEVELAANDSGAEVDVYSFAKQSIFDHYVARLATIGRNGIDIDSCYYQEKDYGEDKKFDRQNIDETMLLKLRTLTERRAEREENRRSG